MTFIAVCAFWCAVFAYEVYATDLNDSEDTDDLVASGVTLALTLVSLVAVHMAAQA